MKKKIKFLSLLFIILFCISFTLKSFQNDSFYIIKLGDYIIHNGIDNMDHFSFIENLTYTYPHWLYDVFEYIIYNNFGLTGVYINNIIFYILLVLSILFISTKIYKNDFYSFILIIVNTAFLSSFVTARSQEVSNILFVWEYYFIIKLLDTGKTRYGIYLCIICILLANIHATIWPMYFILFLPFIVENIIYNLKNKFKNKKIKFGIDGAISKIEINKSYYFKNLIIIFLISLFLGIISPNGICYTYVFRIMLGDSQQYIIEHTPLVVINFPLFIIYILLFLGVWIFSNIKVKLSDLFLLLGIIYMSLSSNRHLSFFFIIGAIIIFKYVFIFYDNSKDKTLNIIKNLLCNKYIYIITIILMFIISINLFNKMQKYEYIDKKDYPVDAVNYIKENLDYKNIRLYNEYGFGSYLIFNDIPVFIDSRSDLYMKQFNNLKYDIFLDCMNMEKNYKNKFEYYKIEYALLDKKSDLSLILDNDENYDVIYKDKYYILYKNNNVY